MKSFISLALILFCFPSTSFGEAPLDPLACPSSDCIFPPLHPRSCSPSFSITVSGLYWTSHQDGLEYAILNQVASPLSLDDEPGVEEISPIETLFDASYLHPSSAWDFGFKIGGIYDSLHDGWSLNFLWTRFINRASTSITAKPLTTSVTLMPIWSAFASAHGSPLYATRIDTNGHLSLNSVDASLTRAFWISQYLSIEPSLGLRFISLQQDYTISIRGGSMGENLQTTQHTSYYDVTSMKSTYKGVGPYTYVYGTWHLLQGLSLIGQGGISLIYGRVSTKQKEQINEILFPFYSTPVLCVSNSLRIPRPIIDLLLGISYGASCAGGKYQFSTSLSWENHLFFNQNLLWRVVRANTPFQSGLKESAPLTKNSNNIYAPARGDFSTQGWTLSFLFSF